MRETAEMVVCGFVTGGQLWLRRWSGMSADHRVGVCACVCLCVLFKCSQSFDLVLFRTYYIV